MTAAINELIRTVDAGDGTAAKELFALLYRELHSLAERQLRRNPGELSLGTTTLLHEAYLSIGDREAHNGRRNSLHSPPPRDARGGLPGIASGPDVG
ncbi:MAG: ECF-type sigma factor [Gemmatimonadales bacterium]